MQPETSNTDGPPARKAGFLQIALAVFWGFFGVRKRRNLDRDMASIKPQHVVVAGLIGALLFIATLILIVRLVIANT
jgi:DUF2970 family protein